MPTHPHAFGDRCVMGRGTVVAGDRDQEMAFAGGGRTGRPGAGRVRRCARAQRRRPPRRPRRSVPHPTTETVTGLEPDRAARTSQCTGDRAIVGARGRSAARASREPSGLQARVATVHLDEGATLPAVRHRLNRASSPSPCTTAGRRRTADHRPPSSDRYRPPRGPTQSSAVRVPLVLRVITSSCPCPSPLSSLVRRQSPSRIGLRSRVAVQVAVGDRPVGRDSQPDHRRPRAVATGELEPTGGAVPGWPAP